MPYQQFGDDDDADISDVLDFSGNGAPGGEDDDEHPAAWDFSVADHDVAETSVTEVTHTHQAAEEDGEDAVPLFTVTNPPGTVSVSALMDGGIDRVGLSEKVAAMTETQLAEEILVMAHLARQQGQAAQHALLLDGMREMGADDTEALRDLLENGLELSSPQQAAATQAEVFANRYRTDS